MTRRLIRPDRLSRAHIIAFALTFSLIGILIYTSFASPNPNLQGDLNNDNKVDGLDLSFLAANYKTHTTSADINGDGIVDIADLALLLENYGKSYAGGGGVSVTPPAPPASYTLPSGAVTVSTTAQLQSAVNGSTKDIILANGDYTNSTYMSIGNHRLWGQSLGGATLHFGLSMGENYGGPDPEVHGIKFNLNNASLGLGGDIISVWGTGQNAVIDDSWFYGNSIMSTGISTSVTSGFQVHRVVVHDFLKYGIFFEANYPDYWTDAPAIEPIVSDAEISNIQEATAGSDGGKAEAGLWAGTNCLCSNLKIRNAGWMGIWTGGNANNGVYSNFDIDNVGSDSVGVYLEHYSRNNVFKNFVIGGSSAGSGVAIGFNCEWADPAYAGTNPVAGQSIAGCHFNTIQDGTIYSNYEGFSLEDAESTTIKNIKFIDQSRAAIKDFMTAGSGQTTVWQNQGNDFTGLKAGAVQYITAH